jgi:UDP:flavonoid glycosyltransferase YjiC (YdhE family)/glycosyltransferase involved in cell wall biosynthesis
VTHRFDLVVAGDARFAGGTSTATAAELRAAAAAGLRCGFLPFRGPVTTKPQYFHPKIRRLLDNGSVAWLETEEDAECNLLLAEHPLVFTRTPTRPVRLKPQAIVCVLQHPPFDGTGAPQYQLPAIERTLARLFGAQVFFAPIGPVVRAQIASLSGSSTVSLTRYDLHNLVEISDWAPRQSRAPGPRAILGRHSRPDPLKWPDLREEIQLAYPEDPDFTVRILGGPPPQERLPAVPKNWEIIPFGQMDVGDFLCSLDFYVYFHSRRWVEAFGVALAEALAVGLVAITDESFKPLFEDGAVYAQPSEVGSVIRSFLNDPSRYEMQSRRARALVERKFSTSNYLQRFRALLEDAGIDRKIAAPVSAAFDASTPPGPRRRRSRRVLFVSSNGVGLGHLTRQLAIARRLPAGIGAAFFTLSQGAQVVEDFGYPVDYVPSHQALGVEFESWNSAFAIELANAVDYFEPGAVIFDGNVPYRGLLDVAASMPDRFWLWVRRAMWKRNQQPEILRRFDAFDAIFEPAEIAADEDVGPTTISRDRVVQVDPILLLDPDERLPREHAIAELALDAGAGVIAVQLGSGANFRYGEIREAILSQLVRAGRFSVVELLSPIASKALAQATPIEGVIKRRMFPSFRFSRAFDLLVTSAGYNSFHECLFGRIPALFVPNESPELDDQLLRARYAETMQLGACLRAKDILRIPEALDHALSLETQQAAAARTERLTYQNGAHAVARFIEECLYSARAEGHLADLIDRV